MKVLVLGANGQMGPHVVKAIEAEHALRLTDINEYEGSSHEYLKIDSGDLNQVVVAAEGMDAIINLSVLRHDRQFAFDVNARGCYNAMTAAVHHGIRRVINTGPHFTIAGATYEQLDHGIGPDIPSQSGTNLYAVTKSLGQEICKVFTENHDIFVMLLMFYNFREPDGSTQPERDTPFLASWRDAGAVFSNALRIELDRLDSRCEQFYVLADMPHGKFSNEKTKRVLGWRPQDSLESYWEKRQP